MKISACYIVRNEENNLSISLDSLCKSVDEIIVVDTGSTDKTKDIASKYQANVYDFIWQDDFSAARNFALSKATGDWIVFLDADEYFSADTAENLRSIINAYHLAEKDVGLLVHLYNIDRNNDDILADSMVLRIIRNKSKYRYKGIIHEELLENGNPIANIELIGTQYLKLMHTGYSKEILPRKAERNLKLLLKELQCTDNPGRLYMYLAEAYLGIGDKVKAKQYAEQDVAQGRRATTYASRSYRILLQLSLENGDDSKKRLVLCQNAVRDFPESPEFRADLAETLATVGDYSQAVAEMQLALDNFYNYKGLEPMLFTEEQAKQATERMHIWQNKMSPSTLEEIAVLLRMLLYPLLMMNAAEYYSIDVSDVLPQGFMRLLERYHGGDNPLDDSCGREYLDALDILIMREEDTAMERLLTFSGDFSPAVRQEIVARINKRIKQIEMRNGEWE